MQIKTDSSGNPTLNQFSKDGFVDCAFKITDLQETDTSYQLQLSASYDDALLGMDVEIIKNIKSGYDENSELIKEHIYRTGLTFKRRDETSDSLIQVIAKLYGHENRDLKMRNEQTFTMIALHQGEIDMVNYPLRTKIFAGDTEEIDQEKYFESYFNIDLKNGYTSWNEKDAEYRVPLLRALSEAP